MLEYKINMLYADTRTVRSRHSKPAEGFFFQNCIETKTFELFDFLGEARNNTQNLTTYRTNVPNIMLLKIGQLCSSIVEAIP